MRPAPVFSPLTSYSPLLCGWGHVREFRADYARGTANLYPMVDLAELGLPSGVGEQTNLLLEAARHLFGDASAPALPLTSLLQRLRDRGYHVLMGALHEYRGHH